MPKAKLKESQQHALRAEIKLSLSKGAKLIDIVNAGVKKYGVSSETIRYYIAKVRSGAPIRKRGRPPGSGKKGPGRPPKAAKRGPGRPPGKAKRGRPPKAVSSTGEIALGISRAQLLLSIGGRQVRVASLLYGDEGRLVSDIRRAVEIVARG